MYNHTTNHWDSEHLMQIDPRYPEVQDYLICWLRNWCEEHPHTTVVRFTSMFYNFVWICGSSGRCRNIFTDWASYDFTVSPLALNRFSKAYVFYDDSRVGIEPYNGRFREFGFDGIIKCVFSGYQARLCSGVPTETHELRLHPYLFPTGVDDSPTFLEGGKPKGKHKNT